MTDRELMIFLQTINGVGWKSLYKIILNLTQLNKIFNLNPLELSMSTDISYQTAEKIINQLTDKNINLFLQKLKEWEDSGLKIITFYDDMYPNMLKEIHQPPWVLFATGRLELLYEPGIAIVGTRNSTQYGNSITEKLASELTASGWTIISGMARGIDRFAHEGALAKNGNTIAVLGSGINIIYPKEHQQLYKNICRNGLILTEHSPDTQPHPSFFPQRNRIISGISYGTIVIEASLKSGSLITAKYALDQSREVFAVPGPITSEQSKGTNILIQQGAKLVSNLNDVLEEFPYLTFNKIPKNEETIKLRKSEQKIFEIIKFDPIHIDDIYKEVQTDLSSLYEDILSLQLKEKIKQLPGGLYVRK